jgi:hypothetical protein
MGPLPMPTEGGNALGATHQLKRRVTRTTPVRARRVSRSRAALERADAVLIEQFDRKPRHLA